MGDFKVSIAMCTYNGEKYLKHQLDSIINQSYRPYEIIISDDCSTDSTLEILKSYECLNKDINFKIMVNKQNIGVTKNFEKALINSTGDFIFLCDQDDIWMENKIERVVREFKKSNTNTRAIFSNAFIINEFSEKQNETLWDLIGFTEQMRRKFRFNEGIDILLKKDVITGCTLAIRRTYLKEVLPLNVNFVHDSWIGMVHELSGGLGLINEPLIYYRIHPSQQIGLNKSRESKIQMKNRYSNTLVKLNSLVEHTTKSSLIDNTKLAKILRKRKFYIDRSSLRIVNITRHFITGDYYHYSSGIKAFLLDFISILRRN